MLKKLHLKLVCIFALIFSLITVIVSFVMILCATNSYADDFMETASRAAQGEIGMQARIIMSGNDRDVYKEVNLETLINQSGTQLELSGDRACYILSATDGSVIAPTASLGEIVMKTPNLENALKAAVGDSFKYMSDYIDYAFYLAPLGTDSEGCIFYMRDNRRALNLIIERMLGTILWCLLGGVVVAVISGVIIGGKVTSPINKIKARAEKFAAGDFDAPPLFEKSSFSEIGLLVKTFNHMGRVMNKTIDQLKAEKHKVEVILEHINNGIIAFDTEQNLIHINSAAKEILRIAEGAKLTFDEFFSELGAEVCMAEFMYLDKFKTETREISIGKDRHIHAYFVPFGDDDRAAGVVCVFEDVTEQFNVEEVRRKFVAEVSHELKTPLTTIKTYTETLLNGYLDDKKMATTLLTTVEKEADKMTNLVHNLLTLSRFDVNKFELNREPISIDDMLRDLTALFKIEAENKGLELDYTRATDIPQIYADRDQLERAVKNVISNAIKYTDSGGKIHIYAGNLYNEVYIKVEDNGRGIPAAELEHVFERFYRVDKARTREGGGTGLGLSIAKEIIENHGGTIKMESKYGKYTKVTINIPMA